MVITDQSLMIGYDESYVVNIEPLYRELSDRYMVPLTAWMVSAFPELVEADALASFIVDDMDWDDIKEAYNDNDHADELFDMNDEYIEHLLSPSIDDAVIQAQEQGLCVIEGYINHTFHKSVFYSVHPQGFLFNEDRDYIMPVSESFIAAILEAENEVYAARDDKIKIAFRKAIKDRYLLEGGCYE